MRELIHQTKMVANKGLATNRLNINLLNSVLLLLNAFTSINNKIKRQHLLTSFIERTKLTINLVGNWSKKLADNEL